MVSDTKLANVVGGKTARACDSCIRKRARWYCAADDAFLCQSCDSSVHSANPLARRHERLRLKTASSVRTGHKGDESKNSLPSWHHGFTRKARTPRHGKGGAALRDEPKSEESIRNPLHLVPELGAEEASHDENEAQLLYRVPIYDPFAAELCMSTTSPDTQPTTVNEAETIEKSQGDQSKELFRDCSHADAGANSFDGFLPSDMEFAEFAADVENLLGKGLDEGSFDMEKLGLLDCREKDSVEGSSGSGGRVKVEEEEDDYMENVDTANQHKTEIDMTRETFEFSFDYDSPVTGEEGDVGGGGDAGYAVVKESEDYEVGELKEEKKSMLLRLDYYGVIAAWDDQRSPWTTGDRPEMDDCWPDCMDACGTVHQYPYGDMGMFAGKGHIAMMDGGREARVSRYREKRRTRLFSKKIRYEVRKLNAEKRPRMKGRFVKRANLGGAAAFPLLCK